MGLTFIEYRDAFERLVVARGVYLGRLGQFERVSVKRGRIHDSSFGNMMGDTVQVRKELALDYYGMIKLSSGVRAILEECKQDHPGRQIRLVEIPLVHFGAIRLEDILDLAPDLAPGFAEFKKTVLDARGFNHNYPGRK